ncbi:MAG: hypothetical protein M3442_21585 [Chloroflexota bacterium]|nr:hypothetical protein [Chloroflexota bacterium]
MARSATDQSARPITRGGAWPWLGLAALVLGYFATWSVQFSVPQEALMEGGQVLLSALNTEGNAALWRLSSGIGYAGVACLVAFGVGLRRLLEERALLEEHASGDSLVPAVVSGGFLVTGGALLVAWNVRAQVFDGLAAYAADPSAHVAINRLSQDTGLAAWAGLGVAAAAFAVGGLRQGLLPAWLGWFSAVITALIGLLCLAGLAFPANIPAGIWLLVVVLWSIRQVR